MATRHFSFEGSDRLLTIGDLAHLLGVTTRAAYNLRHRGLLPPAVKWGNSIRFRPEDIEVWLQAHRDEGVGA